MRYPRELREESRRLFDGQGESAGDLLRHLHGPAGARGFAALAVQAIPFAVMHAGKPAPEAFLAYGFGLGLLALRSGSILPGVLLHYACAASLDLFAFAPW